MIEYKDTAIEAVLKACELTSIVREGLVNEDTLVKKDKSPVTVADYGAQAIILHRLHQAYPEIPFVAEEDAVDLLEEENATLLSQIVSYVQQVDPLMDKDSVVKAISLGSYTGGAAGKFWTLDPIDGTKGFLRNDQYAVALALIEDGRPVFGILGCPNLPKDLSKPTEEVGCLYFAEKGKGAFYRPFDRVEESSISVSQIEDSASANFCESVESQHSSHSDSAIIAQRLGVTKEPVRIDSQCKYATVARGDACIYLRLPVKKGYEEKIWDHAAGVIVLSEAGGKVCDVLGAPLDFSKGRTLKDNTGVVGTAGGVFDSVKETVSELFKSKEDL